MLHELAVSIIQRNKNLQDMDETEGLRPGVAVRTQILSVDNGSVQNITSFRSIQTKAPGGNVKVQIESQDVTKAKGSSANAKIIPPPPKPPNKEDFEVQIKSVERVDGKKPIRPMRNATPSVAKKKLAGSALDIKVWTVTDAPKARNQVPAARREYNSQLWADDWGPKLSCTRRDLLAFVRCCFTVFRCHLVSFVMCHMSKASQVMVGERKVMNGRQQLTFRLRKRRTGVTRVTG